MARSLLNTAISPYSRATPLALHPPSSERLILSLCLQTGEEQGSSWPQRPYLPQCQGEPCRTPSPSISSRYWRSCWPSCCSVTPCWSGRCCSPAGQRTSWCLNERASSAAAASGWPEAPGSSGLCICSTHRMVVPSSCKHLVSLLPNHNLIFLCKKNKD